MSDDDSWLGLAIGGLFGYQLGTNKFSGWEPFIQKFNERLGHLKYFKTIIPLGFFQKEPTSREIYRESIQAYLLGLPNASLPLAIRVLELALKIKYKGTRLALLIDLAESELGQQKDIAHALRMVRNTIHTKDIISEQISLDAIRYSTEIINNLHSFEQSSYVAKCSFCGHSGTIVIQKEDNFIGNSWNLNCSKCQKSNNFPIMP